MTFDGDYVTEGRDFESIDEAWDRSEDMGSRWYFYPFHFVLTASGKTVAESPDNLERFNGKRIKTVAKEFAQLANDPEFQNAEVDEFAFYLR